MDRYVVIGNPIAQSKSPEIHTMFARQTEQDVHYDRLYAPVDGFAQAVGDFIAAGGKGANVTAPFKLEAHALATQLTERARAAGAVNTLTFSDGSITGDNTDGAGLVADITRNAGVSLAGKRILLVGAGGAARGALLPLLNEGPAELVLVNRTAEKAEALARQLAEYGTIDAGGYAHATGVFDVVINATSAGLSADAPPIAAALFGKQTLAYEMVYGKVPTLFMQFAGAQGATVRDGLGMLVEQAAEAFAGWRGVRPQTAAVFDAIRAQM